MRKSTQIVMFLVMMNATAGFLTASGVAADLGISPQPGASVQVGEINDAAQQPNPGGGAGGTLFGLFVSVATIAKDIFVLATVGGPLMLSNLGIPGFIVGFIFAPIYLIVGADLLYIYSGRSI